MIKKHVTCDERYPVYDLKDPTDRELESPLYIEFTDEEFADYQRVEREYENWQETLKKAGGFKY